MKETFTIYNQFVSQNKSLDQLPLFERRTLRKNESPANLMKIEDNGFKAYHINVTKNVKKG